MKLLLLVLAVGFQASLAQAKCDDKEPLCHAMHTLSAAMKCVTGTSTPPAICDTDLAEAALMKSAAADARAVLETKMAKDPVQQKEVDKDFDALDAAIDELSAAVTKGDAPARQKAIDDILAAKKQGHMDFDN